MSVVFGLSIYMAGAKTSTVKNEMIYCDCFLGIGGGGGDSNEKVGLQVIAEKMKICSCLHVGKILIH